MVQQLPTSTDPRQSFSLYIKLLQIYRISLTNPIPHTTEKILQTRFTTYNFYLLIYTTKNYKKLHNMLGSQFSLFDHKMTLISTLQYVCDGASFLDFSSIYRGEFTIKSLNTKQNIIISQE